MVGRDNISKWAQMITVLKQKEDISRDSWMIRLLCLAVKIISSVSLYIKVWKQINCKIEIRAGTNLTELGRKRIIAEKTWTTLTIKINYQHDHFT